MKGVNATHIPNDLNLLQKQRPVEVTKELLDNVAFIKSSSSGDEAGIYEYDTEAVHQSSVIFRMSL